MTTVPVLAISLARGLLTHVVLEVIRPIVSRHVSAPSIVSIAIALLLAVLVAEFLIAVCHDAISRQNKRGERRQSAGFGWGSLLTVAAIGLIGGFLLYGAIGDHTTTRLASSPR